VGERAPLTEGLVGWVPTMDAVFFCGVPVGCVMAYGLVLDAKRLLRDNERDRLGWRDYAERRGFRYATRTKPGPFALRAEHRIEARVHGVSLACSTGLGILRMPTTTMTTQARAPIRGRVYISCDQVFSQAQNDVAARRVDTGDPAFDGGVFFVQATDPEAVPSVLVPPVRRVLMQMSASGRQSLNFRCERDEVAVEWLGIEPLPDLFDLGCDLMVAASQSRRHGGVYR
jgi:hypothetical protein